MKEKQSQEVKREERGRGEEQASNVLVDKANFTNEMQCGIVYFCFFSPYHQKNVQLQSSHILSEMIDTPPILPKLSMATLFSFCPRNAKKSISAQKKMT
jgi:hypothetical protein